MTMKQTSRVLIALMVSVFLWSAFKVYRSQQVAVVPHSQEPISSSIDSHQTITVDHSSREPSPDVSLDQSDRMLQKQMKNTPPPAILNHVNNHSRWIPDEEEEGVAQHGLIGQRLALVDRVLKTNGWKRKDQYYGKEGLQLNILGGSQGLLSSIKVTVSPPGYGDQTMDLPRLLFGRQFHRLQLPTPLESWDSSHSEGISMLLDEYRQVHVSVGFHEIDGKRLGISELVIRRK